MNRIMKLMSGVVITAVVGLILLLIIGSILPKRAAASKSPSKEDSPIPLRIFPLKDFPGLQDIFSKKDFDNGHCVDPNLGSTKLKHANFLSAFLISAYSELCRDGALLRKSFLDNLYEDTDTVSNWLGYSAAQLKEAAQSAAQIVNERKPKLEEFTKEELADLTVSFFYAVLKKIGKEHSAEVEKKKKRDKMDIFSNFEKEVCLDDTDNQIKSVFLVIHCLKYGFALKVDYEIRSVTYKSEIMTMQIPRPESFAICLNRVRNYICSEFVLTNKTDYTMHILQDFKGRDEVYGIIFGLEQR